MLDFRNPEDQYSHMSKLHLEDLEKLKLEKRHRQARDGKERDRIKAILLKSEDWSLNQISQALRINVASITRHIDDYVESKKLSNNSGGSSSKLSKEQTEALVEHLIANTYHHQKDIIGYIKKTWDIEYTVSGINKWLQHNRFSYKKPKAMPYKVDLEKQAAFIADYEQLKSNLAADEAIFFMDAVHPTQATKVSSGWIRTGTDKPVKTTASRTRINIVGAIELNQIADAVTSQYSTVNGESIIDFMELLRQKNRSKGRLHLILDGAGYHRAQTVVDKADKLGIKLHYLPPYSPNLNPIERLWKVMNEKVRNNQCFHSAKDFREKINHFFDTILPEIGATLSSRINDNFQSFDPTFSG